MTILSAAAGLVLIAAAVHDIFTVLFRPGAKSRFSSAIARVIWTLLRRAAGTRRNVLAFAGPLALVAVICFWAAALIVGWTLIYLPHYPGDYVLAEGTVAHPPFIGALHASLTTVTTLGSANAVPKTGWLQVVGPVEALLGFCMLTAAVSWLLQVYPVLSSRRALAYEIHLLADTEHRLDIDVTRLETSVASQLYAELTSRLIGVERDLVKFPITYYFAETDARFSLAAAMPLLAEIAERGGASQLPDSVRLRAAMLQEAIDDLVSTIAERFALHRRHDISDGAGALQAFAEDHRHEADCTAPDANRPAAIPGP